jgi:hypothetical protein
MKLLLLYYTIEIFIFLFSKIKILVLRQPLTIETDQEPIEQSVQVGGQEKAVEDIETFGIGRAVGPGFGVAGAQHLRQGDSGHSAGTAPVLEHRGAEGLLADALAHNALDFGASERVG